MLSLGVLLIVFGVFVAVYPQILVLAISTMLVMAGTVLCIIGWKWRQMRKAGGSSGGGAFTSWITRI